MEEQFILRVPPSVAERIERLLSENASSSEDGSLDLSFSGIDVESKVQSRVWERFKYCAESSKIIPKVQRNKDGRSGAFMIGNESFPASLLDLPTIVESYKTYDDTVLIKTADVGQVIMVREDGDPAPEGVEYKHGLTPPMRDARRRRFRRETDLNPELVQRVERDLINIMSGVTVENNVGMVEPEEGANRRKAAPTSVSKPVAPAEAAVTAGEPERSDTDESMGPEN